MIYDEELNRIYMATGNGPFKPLLHRWGDTVFALNPDGTGKDGDPLDSYTPKDYSMLESRDLDLGSTAPAILPVPKNSVIKHLSVQSGKDGKLRLLNLDNLSGRGRLGGIGGEIGKVINVPQRGMILTAIAVWVDPADRNTWIFVANSEGTSGLRLTIDSQGIPALSPVWKNSFWNLSDYRKWRTLLGNEPSYTCPGSEDGQSTLGKQQDWRHPLGKSHCIKWSPLYNG